MRPEEHFYDVELGEEDLTAVNDHDVVNIEQPKPDSDHFRRLVAKDQQRATTMKSREIEDLSNGLVQPEEPVRKQPAWMKYPAWKRALYCKEVREQKETLDKVSVRSVAVHEMHVSSSLS